MWIFIKKIVPKKFYIRLRDVYLKFVGGYDNEVGIILNNKRKRSFVDVGANLGTYSIPASRVYDKVYCYEPNKKIATLLKSTNIKNMIVNNYALSNYNGQANLNIPVFNKKSLEMHSQASIVNGFSGNVNKVNVVKLDDENIDCVDAIKIDVEGAEFDVLEGAKATIEKHKPLLVVELEERHHNKKLKDMIKKISGYGYVPFYTTDGIETQIIADLDKDLELLSKMGINNFIFKANSP